MSWTRWGETEDEGGADDKRPLLLAAWPHTAAGPAEQTDTRTDVWVPFIDLAQDPEVLIAKLQRGFLTS